MASLFVMACAFVYGLKTTLFDPPAAPNAVTLWLDRANLRGLVLGCIEAKFCKKICFGDFKIFNEVMKKKLVPTLLSAFHLHLVDPARAHDPLVLEAQQELRLVDQLRLGFALGGNLSWI